MYFLRLDSIQCSALIPFRLTTDSIHGFAVICCEVFLSKRCIFLEVTSNSEEAGWLFAVAESLFYFKLKSNRFCGIIGVSKQRVVDYGAIDF